MKTSAAFVLILMGFSTSYANVNKDVTENNFKEGVYRSYLPAGPIDGRQEVQHCAEYATFLLNEADKNNIKIQRFECVMDGQAAYEVILFKK